MKNNSDVKVMLKEAGILFAITFHLSINLNGLKYSEDKQEAKKKKMQCR